MKKTSPFSVKHKKKNFLALCIKVCIVIAIPLIYFISSTGFNGNQEEVNQGKHYSEDQSA